MKYKKIFVIGFNKTASTTFHHLFLKAGLDSHHSTDWEKNDAINIAQCFSDGDAHIKENHPINFKKLETRYPESLFILNVRELESWLLSRAKHGMWVMKENSIFTWPPTIEEYQSWISKRIYHHNNVLNYFKDKSEKLLIVNTDNNKWIEFVAEHIGFNYNEYFKSNVSSIKQEDLKLIQAKNVLNETFTKLRYTVDEKRSLNLNKSLCSMYKNNIDWNYYPNNSIHFILKQRRPVSL